MAAFVLSCVALCLQLLAAHAGEAPLPSRQDADARRAIVSFVRQAAERGWTVVDMKRDWKVVYPFEETDKSETP